MAVAGSDFPTIDDSNAATGSILKTRGLATRGALCAAALAGFAVMATVAPASAQDTEAPAETPGDAPAEEPAPPPSSDNGSKPDIDGSGDMGITRNDVRDVEKAPAAQRVAPRPRPRAAPAPRRAPSTRPQDARPGPVRRTTETADRVRERGFLSGHPYVWGSLGWVNPEDADLSPGSEAELASSLHYAGAVGWHFDNGLRAELEVDYFEVDIDSINGTSVSGDLEALAGMANLVYEWPRFRLIKPYVGGGIGLTGYDASGGGISDDDVVLTWQFIIGAAVPVTPRFAVTADYRYFGGSDPEFDGVEAEISGHKLLAGVRWTFGR